MQGTTDPQPAPARGPDDQVVALLERVLSRLDQLEARMDRLALTGALPTHTSGPASDPIAARLKQPHVAAAVGRILDRADVLADALDLAQGVPGLVAMGADLADAAARAAQDGGVDLDGRLKALGALAIKISQPEIISALESTLDLLPKATPHLEAIPQLGAMAVDIVDEWVRRAVEKGLNPEIVLRNSLSALGRLGGLLESQEFSCLMASGMLNPQALLVIGQAAGALSASKVSEQKTGEHKPLGLFGLLKVLKDPDIQRALHFTLGFARRFGAQMDQPLPELEGPVGPCGLPDRRDL